MTTMRLGLVERGNYKTTEYADLSGYELEVNGLVYNFGNIIAETRQRVRELWNYDCPPSLLRERLHFSEERYFNRMVKSEHYGIFSRHTGAHVCLGLVPEAQTYNLVIHEIAHEIHYRQGRYEGADEVVQEALAIMAEEEYEVRPFEWNPHFTAQQLLHQLKELPGFGGLSFGERWNLLAALRSSQQLSYMVNRFADGAEGRPLGRWLETRLADPAEARPLLNELAQTTLQYALYNRRLLIARLTAITTPARLGPAEVNAIVRALQNLRKLDQVRPHESLADLIKVAFGD